MSAQAAIACSSNEPFVIEGKETIRFPVILEHEATGSVEAIGADISLVKEGWTYPPSCFCERED